MLYVTTRNKNDAHTAHKTLMCDRASDGGLYVPFQFPSVGADDLQQLKDKSFGQCVADILNSFFSARLDGWDVDFCIGRYPVKLVPMSHRIVVAETWHNPDWDFARMVRNLYSRLCGNDDNHGVPSSWAWIAIRIAAMFGVYGQLLKKGLISSEGCFDVSVPIGDFSGPMAAWYAREMGLPVGRIIFACNDNSGMWDLLNHSQLRTDTIATTTNTPMCDLTVPENLERLLYACGGAEAVHNFLAAYREGQIYMPEDSVFQKIRQGMFSAVVSDKRMESVISTVYRTCTYLMDPYGALAYGGLQDFRATAGEGRLTVIFTEQSPICSAATVSKAMGITVQDLKERLSMT